MNYNDKIKQLLDDIIHQIANNKNNYVLNPDVDFTRNRKLPFEMVVKIILSMKGGSLNKELYEFFGRDPEAIATSSAFIQQRDKLSTQLFVDLFNMFNASMTNVKTFNGYRLLAVDGSCINIADDKNADTYVKPKKVKLDGELARGYNQYHLNAIYDILNKVYVDVMLHPNLLQMSDRPLLTCLKICKLMSLHCLLPTEAILHGICTPISNISRMRII